MEVDKAVEEVEGKASQSHPSPYYLASAPPKMQPLGMESLKSTSHLGRILR